jgi:hypothetical protein
MQTYWLSLRLKDDATRNYRYKALMDTIRPRTEVVDRAHIVRSL